MTEVLRLVRGAIALAFVLGYAFLAHYTNTTPNTETLGMALALAPIVLAGFTMAWHATQRVAMLAVFGLSCLLLALGWGHMKQHYSLVYWIEHAGTELMLCLMFWRTLRAGREPMCTYFARMAHGTLGPEMMQYSRQVTKAWVAFFATMALASTTLFLFAPLQIWSTFANFFTAPLIALMFIAEYGVRRLLLPNIEHVHILDGIKAFWNQPAR